MGQFPKDFFWGSSCSAYQVEGGNFNNDWWEWEKQGGTKEPSGNACSHYELYEKDFELAKSLNHNAHRLSIEWSRIEPEEGKFSTKELEHYKSVILSLKKYNIAPVVTLHHFTNPLWLAKSGGWENPKSVDYFFRFVRKVVEDLCGEVTYWVTINEPLVYTYYSYTIGIWPPQVQSFKASGIVTDNLLKAHIKAYKVIHDIYKQNSLLPPLVSIAKNLQVFAACRPTLKNKLAVYLRNKFFNFDFIHKLIKNNALDFIGINYYMRELIDVKGWGIDNLLLDVCVEGHSKLAKNSLGWDIYPQGLYDFILYFKKYNLPLFILENGICTDDDNTRWNFIREHLLNIHRAMNTTGVKVLGYLYWSLIDNYEWDKGFSPRFGLAEVDYKTQKRKVRESANKFAQVCKSCRLD